MVMVARPERMAARYLAGRLGQSGQGGNRLEIFLWFQEVFHGFGGF